MTLPLISPVGSDFIKNWTAQNKTNCDLIDAAAGSYNIQSYIPILTSSVTNPSLGTGGFITGFYYQVFDFITTWGEFRFKTGFNQGSGTFEVTLPFPASTIISPNTGSGSGPLLGNARIWVNASSSSRQPATVQLRTANKIMFSVRFDSGGSGRAVGSNIPAAWAIDDGINWIARYRRLNS